MMEKCPYCYSDNTYLYIDYPELTHMYHSYVHLRFKCECMDCERIFYFDRKYQELEQLAVWKSEDLEQEVDE